MKHYVKKMIFVKAGRRLCLALLVACFILFMSSCGGHVSETAPEGTSTPTDEPISLDEIYGMLFSQLDPLLDDAYRCLGDPVLTDIRYGSFTKAGENELLANFRYPSTPGNRDMIVSAIYSLDKSEIITHEIFRAGKVSLYYLPAKSGQTHILFLGASTYQGLTTYRIELFRIDRKKWNEIPLGESVSESVSGYAINDIHYIFTSDMELIIKDNPFSISPIPPDPPITIGTFAWDPGSAEFLSLIP